MSIQSIFDSSPELRQNAWKKVIAVLEDYYSNTSMNKVSPDLNVQKIKEYVCKYDFTIKKVYKIHIP